MSEDAPIAPTLEGERLRLVSLTPDHSEGMYELWSEPGVCRYSGPAVDANGQTIELPAPSRAESDRLLAYWLHRARARDGFRWAVVDSANETFIGAAGFNALGESAEYAYHLIPRFWGRGLAQEAARLAIGWAFENGATVVECFVEDANARSIRLLERLGFEPRGDAQRCDTRFELRRPPA